MVYLAYKGRWVIEVLFGTYKNIIDRDEVNVQTDYRLHATELVNFLSVLITTRVQKTLRTTVLDPERKNKRMVSEVYSYKQLFIYLSKYKKIRTDPQVKWQSTKRLKYIEQLCDSLGI